jgi:hypothetical protein
MSMSVAKLKKLAYFDLFSVKNNEKPHENNGKHGFLNRQFEEVLGWR